MTTLIFPSIASPGFPAKRTPQWKTDVQTSVSGKETRIARWVSPKWLWELPYECLRMLAGQPAEFQSLVSFYNSCQGAFQTFLYADADDNQVAGQQIGVGDGVTTTFQLVRAFGGLGGFVEAIYAPNAVTAVYVNGAVQGTSTYTVNAWGSGSPGKIVFNTAPASGAAITVDFSFYFPCRFTDDKVDFDRIFAGIYAAQKLAFQLVK